VGKLRSRLSQRTFATEEEAFEWAMKDIEFYGVISNR
jgi:hypothetical protein